MKSSNCILSDLKIALLDDPGIDDVLDESSLHIKDEVNSLRVAVADFLISQIKPETVQMDEDFKFVLEMLRTAHFRTMGCAFLRKKR